MRRGPRLATLADYPDLLARFDRGESVKSLAAHYGASQTTLWRVLREAGRARPVDCRDADRDAAVVAAVRSGRTMADVAAEHGITYQRVQQILRRSP